MNDSTNDSTLSVEHVSKRFGSGETEVMAVRDISLSVAPGEVVLIMGPSGSGKSTLLSMLGALLKPTEGEIRLGDEVLSALSENRLPSVRLRQFGFIFQDFNLLSALTVLENVALVAELAGAKRVRRAGRPGHSSPNSGSARGPTSCQRNSRGARNSAWPSPARSSTTRP